MIFSKLNCLAHRKAYGIYDLHESHMKTNLGKNEVSFMKITIKTAFKIIVYMKLL